MSYRGASIPWPLDCRCLGSQIRPASLASCAPQAPCHWALSRFGRSLELGRNRKVRACLLSLPWMEEGIFWPWLPGFE